ncbi:MAG: hypothetical protein ACNA8W_15020 [Bradymonadaceae bacterium]
MSRDPISPRSRGEFVKLANACGFVISPVDLLQLNRRKFLEPLPSSGESESYCDLHLYALAQYFDSVRPVRHPWATVAPERTLDEVGQLGRRIGGLVQLLSKGEELGEEERHDVADLVLEMERYLNGIDPFGPIAEVIDVLREDVVRELRGTGRLYVELHRTARALAAIVEGVDEAVGLDAPSLGEEFSAARESLEEDGKDLRSTQIMETSVSRDEPSLPEESVPEELSVASEASEAVGPLPEIEISEAEISEAFNTGGPVTEASDAPEVLQVPEKASEVSEVSEVSEAEVLPDESVALTVQMGLDEETSDPLVLLDEAISSAPAGQFERVNSEVTTQNEVLLKRLHELSQHDEAVATVRDNVGEEPEDRRDLGEKIAELNRLRESYLKAQAWQELVDLYENGIDLFTEAAERQQVLLVLGMLYETKLKREETGFHAFIKAYELEGTAGSRLKAWDGICRLGRTVGLQPSFVTWLEDRLEKDLGPEERRRVQREYALGLYARGEGQRAFFLYASMLADDPDGTIQPAALAELDELAVGVAAEEVDNFYRDILEQDLDPRVRSLIERRATG